MKGDKKVPKDTPRLLYGDRWQAGLNKLLSVQKHL